MSKFAVGQEINSGDEQWLVTKVFEDSDDFEFVPMAMSGHMDSYLDFGKTYKAEFHKNSPCLDLLGIWEVPPEQMKRDSSQVLCYLWEKTGPSIEIDF